MEEIIINPEIVSEICGYIRAGADFATSAMAAGFNEEKIEKMLILLSAKAEGLWKEFADDIKKATAQFEVMQLMKINAEGGARGAQWLLEKKVNKNSSDQKSGKPYRKSSDQNPVDFLGILDNSMDESIFKDF